MTTNVAIDVCGNHAKGKEVWNKSHVRRGLCAYENCFKDAKVRVWLEVKIVSKTRR